MKNEMLILFDVCMCILMLINIVLMAKTEKVHVFEDKEIKNDI